MLAFKSRLLFKWVACLFLCLILSGQALYAQDSDDGASSAESDTTEEQTLERDDLEFRYSDNLDSSESTGLFFEKDQAFVYSDINPSQGSLQFQNADLVFPGRNGLDLVIQRVYNSRNFNNTNFNEFDSSKGWAGYMGQGWSLTPFQRAYFLKGDLEEKTMNTTNHHTIDKVVIESTNGGDIYLYNVNTNDYKSDNPQNKNKVTVKETDSGSIIYLKDTNGHTYEFASEDSQIAYLNHPADPIKTIYSNGYVLKFYLHMTSGYIKRISNSFGNSIEFTYKEVSTQQKDILKEKIITNFIEEKISNLIMKVDKDLLLKDSITRFESKVPDKIIDSMGREITFYTNGTNDWNDEKKKLQITGFSYTNVNGGTNYVDYQYNKEGVLTSAGMRGQPQFSYAYKNYDPGFSYISYEVEHRGKNNNDRLYGAYYLADLDDWAGARTTHEHINEPYKNLQGSVLNQVTTPLGLKTKYEYEDCLTAIKKPQWGNHYFYNTIIESGSFPVVVEKRVKDPKGLNDHVYTFEYDKDTNGLSSHLSKYIQKSTYSPFWAEETMYIPYFKNVTIHTPDELTDIKLKFEKGLPISETKTINGVSLESKTEWDFSNNHKKESGSYKNGVLQTKTTYLDYDSYDHPQKIETYVGSTLLNTKTVSYWTDSVFIDQNIFSLVKTQKVTDGNITRSTTMEYYNNGKLKTQYKGDSTAGLALVNITYDNYGQVTSKTTKQGPAGDITVYNDYSGGENGLNLTVKTTFNGKTTEQEFEYNTGKLIKATDLNGNVSSVKYDDIGRKKTVTNPDGTEVNNDYSEDFKTISQTYLGNTVTTKLDNFGRVIEENYPEGQEDIKTEYYFGNTVDKVYKKVNGMWKLQADMNYDKALRPVSKYVPEWGTTYTSYDDLNNTIKTTDYVGRESIQTMDKLGRPTEALYVPDGSKTTFHYTTFGEKDRTTDARGLKHDVDYDKEGRLLYVYDTYNQGIRKIKKEFSYYANGQPKATKIYNPNQTVYKTIEFVYDNEERVTGLKENGTQKEWLYFEEPGVPNSVGQLTSAENGDVKTSYSFDHLGRVTKETTDIKKLNKQYSIGTSYTESGQADTIIFDDNKIIDYDYDSLQRVKTISYDGKNIATYTYKANGSIDKMTYGNGMVIDYSYENETNTSSPKREVLLSKIEAISNSNETIQEELYTFDGKGNISTSKLTHPVTNELGTKTYTYTIKDELSTISLESPSYSQTNFKEYNYDKNGNVSLFSVPDKDDTPKKLKRTINTEKDQVLSQTNEDGSSYTFTYDPEGNLTKKIYTGTDGKTSTTVYSYNYQGQLERVVKDGKTLGNYEYNHKRLRVYSNTNSSALWGGEKYYYWDGFEHIIGEGSVEHGDHIVRYIYSGNEKIAMVRPKDLKDRSKGESIYWFVNNAQGTPTKIVNESGTVVQYNNVDEWGNPAIPSAGNHAEINFTGKKYDPITGLYYFNQRYYSPALGMFLSEDPAGQGLNPYAYCGNNPMGYIDPDGEWAWLVPVLVEALKGAAIKAVQSAAINATVQWVANDFNSSKINWDSVGQSALGGAITGGLGLDGISPFNDLNPIGRIGNDMLQGGINNVVGGISSGQHMSLDNTYQMFGQGALRTGAISAIREIHYARNVFNRPETATKLLDDKKSKLHKFYLKEGELSKKFTSFWGFSERVDIVNSMDIIIRGTSIANQGTFNFMPWWTFIGHAAVDVFPYYIWGNGNNDPVTFGEKVRASF